jgi:hypothetical protein
MNSFTSGAVKDKTILAIKDKKKMRAVKDKTCGVNPSSGRCKKGEAKDKDMCDINKKTNYCIKNKYTEAEMNKKIFKGGDVKDKTILAIKDKDTILAIKDKKKMRAVKDKTCGVNPSSGRCKKGESKDKDMCDLNKKTNYCIKNKYTEAEMYKKLKL